MIPKCAEFEVVGSLLLGKEEAERVKQLAKEHGLAPGHFAHPVLRELFRACLTLDRVTFDATRRAIASRSRAGFALNAKLYELLVRQALSTAQEVESSVLELVGGERC